MQLKYDRGHDFILTHFIDPTLKMDDGSEEEFGPGDVSYLPPGHNAWIIGSEPFVAVDFTGMKEYAKK
jgi:hypothetical protein